MNVLVSKSAHAESPINIDSPSRMTSYGRTPYSSSLPSQNRSTLISILETVCSVSSDQPAVTFFVTNNIWIRKLRQRLQWYYFTFFLSLFPSPLSDSFGIEFSIPCVFRANSSKIFCQRKNKSWKCRRRDSVPLSNNLQPSDPSLVASF